MLENEYLLENIKCELVIGIINVKNTNHGRILMDPIWSQYKFINEEDNAVLSIWTKGGLRKVELWNKKNY